MKKYFPFIFFLFAIVGKYAVASHGMTTWSNLIGKPNFARVAYDSSYRHLRDTPVLSTVGITNNYNDLSNKPILFDGNYNSLTNKPTLFNGDFNSLTNKPSLFSGVYADLTGKPNLSVYTQYSDTNTKIATKYDLALMSLADTSNKVLLYGSSGRITNKLKLWTGIITPSTATGQTINISSAGFNTVLSTSVDLEYNGGLVWNTIASRTTTQITCNLYRPNTSLVSVLGFNVLQGVPFLTANDLSNMRLHVTVIGY